MQWLFEGSDEAPDCPGLGADRRAAATGCAAGADAEGAARRLERARHRTRPSRLLDGVADGAQVYFTHSYAAPVTGDTVAVDRRTASRSPRSSSAATSPACSSTRRNRATSGLQILRNFAASCVGLNASMLSKRIIACLDVRDGQVVKGINFEGLRDAGDPAELARRYNVEGIDELVILDITATIEAAARAGRHDPRRRARAVHPAGGRRRHPHRSRRRGGGRAGADKVSLNTAALADPALITTLAGRYGSQAVVVAIDAKRDGRPLRASTRAAAGATGARRGRMGARGRDRAAPARSC